LKYFEISLTSLGVLAGMGGGSFLMLASLSKFFSSFLSFLRGLTFRVYLKDIFYLKEFSFLLAKREFYSELYVVETSFHIDLPIP